MFRNLLSAHIWFVGPGYGFRFNLRRTDPEE